MHLLDHWPDMLTAEETAKILRIDTDTLAGFLQAGEIRHMKIAEKVIIPRKFLEDFLEIKLKTCYNKSVERTVSVLTARTSTLTTVKNWIVCHFKKEKMKWLKSPVPSRLTA